MLKEVLYMVKYKTTLNIIARLEPGGVVRQPNITIGYIRYIYLQPDGVQPNGTRKYCSKLFQWPFVTHKHVCRYFKR